MKPEPLRVVSGLSVAIAGVILFAVIDEQRRTCKIVQRGACVNGSAAAVEAAKVFLRQRAKRCRPELEMVT